MLVRCRPTACKGCGAALAETGQRRVRRGPVVELPGLAGGDRGVGVRGSLAGLRRAGRSVSHRRG